MMIQINRDDPFYQNINQTLKRMQPGDIHRFKHEKRSLQSVTGNVTVMCVMIPKEFEIFTRRGWVYVVCEGRIDAKQSE